MKRFSFLLIVLSFVLIGCKGNREKNVVGSWSAEGSSLTAAADKTFKTNAGPFNVEGTWSLSGDDVTFTTKSLNGKTVEEVKAVIQKSALGRAPESKGFIEAMEKPNFMRLSSDGKTMTVDKAKNPSSSASGTYTKTSS